MSAIPDIENLFRHHPPAPDQVAKYEALRSGAKSLATLITQLVPYSAEQSTALRKVREAVMWANAGIACNEHGAASLPAAVTTQAPPGEPLRG